MLEGYRCLRPRETKKRVANSMSDVIQLVYASRSNLHSHSDPEGIESGIGGILLQSRRNNLSNDIGGALCFGNDYFLQCLEGYRDAVEPLYDDICSDDRHRDVTLLLKRPIPQRRFRAWSMKYLALDNNIRDMLNDHGLKSFEPFKFDTELTLELLDVFQKSSEREHLSQEDPNWQRLQAGGLPMAREANPLKFLGIGAIAAAVVAIILFAVGLR